MYTTPHQRYRLSATTRLRHTLAEVWRVALPLIVSTLSWTIMHFIDRVLLMGYSTDAVAAALPAGMLAWNVVCLPLGIASYSNTFVSQYYGAKRNEQIGPAVWQGIWISLAATPLVLLTIPLAGPLFGLFEHDRAIEPLEVSYFQINAWGAGAIMLSSALSAFFTGRGRVVVVMLVDSFAAALNVVLDYAWIYGHWGFPEAGIDGASWATVVALWVKTVIYVALFFSPNNRRAFQTASGWHLQPQLCWRLLRYGAPNGLQLLIEAAAYTGFLLLVGRLGVEPLAATNLAWNVNNLAFMPVVGVGIATTTLVGKHLGRERVDRASRVAWAAFVLAGGYMLILSAIYAFAPDSVLLFHWMAAGNTEIESLRSTTHLLLIFVAIYSFFDAMAVIFSAAIKGAGDTWFVFQMMVGVAVALTSGTWFALGQGGGLFDLWGVMTAVIASTGVGFLLRFLAGRWRTMRVIEHAEPEPGA
jgi:MATE family multidrug resistance protein